MIFLQLHFIKNCYVINIFVSVKLQICKNKIILYKDLEFGEVNFALMIDIVPVGRHSTVHTVDPLITQTTKVYEKFPVTNEIAQVIGLNCVIIDENQLPHTT